MIYQHVNFTFGTRRGLAPAATAPRCAATRARYGASHHGTACASATDATSATTATPTASAAAATAASAPCQLHAAAGVLLVEEMEGGQADVSHFLFIERDCLTGSKVGQLLYVGCRHGGRRCASRQRERQPCGSERRHGDFGDSLLPFRSLLRLPHGRTSEHCKKRPSRGKPTLRK